MYTKKVMLKHEQTLALQKASFELKMAASNLQFMIDQHSADPADGYLDSTQYCDMLDDYMTKYMVFTALQKEINDQVFGVHRFDYTYQFVDNFFYVEYSSENTIGVLPDYDNNVPVSLDRRFTSFVDFIAMCYPAGLEGNDEASSVDRVLTRTVTFQVTDACNLACTYCYQINKGIRRMKFETAQLFVDKLLSGEDGFSDYITPEKSPGIVIEFIGGEPFLEIDLMDQIVDYFRLRCIELNHPWKDMFCISVCSNGVLYNDPKVQKFLQKNKDCISFSVTLDGNKSLHDACRVFPDGSGSFDIAEAAAKDWISRGYYMGSKITISPDNMPYIYDALMYIIGLGYTEINANCVYEAEWTAEQGKDLYDLLKRFSDFLLSDKKYKDIDCSMLLNNVGRPKAADDLQNWCGGTGSMLSMDPDGWLYPCIRYMESSLGKSQIPMRIGHVTTGVATCTEHRNCVDCLNAIDRRTQSTDECFYCPIAEGCSWCSAWNYQKHGTPDHRDTNICNVHKGRVLANVYYWNNYYKKYGIADAFDLWLPKDLAVEIIGEDEYNKLCELVEEQGGYINEHEHKITDYVPDGED